ERGDRFGRQDTRAALVFALQLFCDLVEHLDATRLEHVPQLAQLVRVGFEVGERGKDLTGSDETALANLVEHADCNRLRRATRGACRGYAGFFGLSRFCHRHHWIGAAPTRLSTLPTARPHVRPRPNARPISRSRARRAAPSPPTRGDRRLSASTRERADLTLQPG